MSVPGGSTGWHRYTYSPAAYPCLGGEDDCGADGSPGHRRTNYYRCKHCRKKQFFDSKIATFRSDDIARCEAAKRMGHRTPLAVCNAMKGVWKEFMREGGTIAALTKPEDQPRILWDGAFIRGVIFSVT